MTATSPHILPPCDCFSDGQVKYIIVNIPKVRVEEFMMAMDRRTPITPQNGEEAVLWDFLQQNLRSFAPMVRVVSPDGVRDAIMTAGGEVI